MSLKRKTAAKPSKAKTSGSASKVKKPVVKPTVKAGGKAAVVKAKAAPIKAAAKTSSVKPVAAKPVTAKAAPKPTTDKVEKTQVEKAKAALKKANGQVNAAEVKNEGAAPVAKPRGRKLALDINPNEAASALAAKWTTLYKKAEQIESKPYNMKSVFEERTAIVHKVLGWGYILANRNDRLEVLFKDGIKYLISNYKPS